MITKQHIDEYIRLRNNNQGIGGHSSPPKLFKNNSYFKNIDELFSRMILEKNMKVSNEIKDRTTEIIATIFASNDTFFILKNM